MRNIHQPSLYSSIPFFRAQTHTLFVEQANSSFLVHCGRRNPPTIHLRLGFRLPTSRTSNQSSPIKKTNKKNYSKNDHFPLIRSHVLQTLIIPTLEILHFPIPKKNNSSPLSTHLSSSHPPFDRSSGHGHFALGQGARLVAANHGSRTQGFDRSEFSSGETQNRSCRTTFIPKK